MSTLETASEVCTLFEGHYHHGVGALVNSLYANGFRGVIWAGYRGELPPWASTVREEDGYREFSVGEECVIRFIPVETRMHLTNFKPDFMRLIWQQFNPAAPAIAYFDPDIAIKCPWSFYENWLSCGVALCEDITNGRMRDNHPIREAWKKLGSRHGFTATQRTDQYFNAGFVGVARDNIDFLSCWSNLMTTAEKAGLVDLSCMNAGQRRSDIFTVIDQDALNMAVMFSGVPLSTIGPEGMDFIHGGYTMSHGVGSPKPWRKKMFISAVRGYAPGPYDKEFLQHVLHPIGVFDKSQELLKKIDLRAGAAIGRFYGRR